MKLILSGVLTMVLLTALHIPVLKDQKRIILVIYSFGITSLFVLYNVKTIRHILQFYQPVQQTVYQADFLYASGYTDAFLDGFLKEKTVYTPDDAYNLAEEDSESPRLYAYYHAYNIWNYLESNDAKIIREPLLNDFVLTAEQKTQFEELGYANDLLRYTFPFTKYADKYGNGFFYYWYYCAYTSDSRVYLCADGLKNAKELVMLWETEDDGVTENYYIISKEQFRNLSSPPQQQPGGE